MIGINEIVIGGMVIVAILLVVLALALRAGKRSQQDVTFSESLPEHDPLVSQGEFQATPIAEIIEEKVRQKAAEDPSLAELNVDFGTGADGGLEIWVESQLYKSVEDVPNEALRAAIREAVEEYNEG